MKCCICGRIWDLGEAEQDEDGDFMCSYCFEENYVKTGRVVDKEV